MDPNLFTLDWERLFEVLIGIVVLAFMLERALAPLFESRFFIKRFDKKSLKEPIAFLIGAIVCRIWDFDALSMIFLKGKTTLFGAVVTGAIVAGGSKASLKLFHDIFNVMSQAKRDELKAKEKGGEPK